MANYWNDYKYNKSNRELPSYSSESGFSGESNLSFNPYQSMLSQNRASGMDRDTYWSDYKYRKSNSGQYDSILDSNFWANKENYELEQQARLLGLSKEDIEKQKKKKEDKPNILFRVLGALGSVGNAVQGGLYNALDKDDSTKWTTGAWEGFKDSWTGDFDELKSGKEVLRLIEQNGEGGKTTADLINHIGSFGIKGLGQMVGSKKIENFGDGLAGLAFEILTDPTTFINAPIKGLTMGNKAQKGLAITDDIARKVVKDNIDNIAKLRPGIKESPEMLENLAQLIKTTGNKYNNIADMKKGLSIGIGENAKTLVPEQIIRNIGDYNPLGVAINKVGEIGSKLGDIRMGDSDTFSETINRMFNPKASWKAVRNEPEELAKQILFTKDKKILDRMKKMGYSSAESLAQEINKYDSATQKTMIEMLESDEMNLEGFYRTNKKTGEKEFVPYTDKIKNEVFDSKVKEFMEKHGVTIEEVKGKSQERISALERQLESIKNPDKYNSELDLGFKTNKAYETVSKEIEDLKKMNKQIDTFISRNGLKDSSKDLIERQKDIVVTKTKKTRIPYEQELETIKKKIPVSEELLNEIKHTYEYADKAFKSTYGLPKDVSDSLVEKLHNTELGKALIGNEYTNAKKVESFIYENKQNLNNMLSDIVKNGIETTETIKKIPKNIKGLMSETAEDGTVKYFTEKYDTVVEEIIKDNSRTTISDFTSELARLDRKAYNKVLGELKETNNIKILANPKKTKDFLNNSIKAREDYISKLDKYIANENTLEAMGEIEEKIIKEKKFLKEYDDFVESAINKGVDIPEEFKRTRTLSKEQRLDNFRKTGKLNDEQLNSVEKVMDFFDNLANEEISEGLMESGQKIGNYVHHMFTEEMLDAKALDGLDNSAREKILKYKNKLSTSKERKVKMSIKEANEWIKKETDGKISEMFSTNLAEIVLNRGIKSGSSIRNSRVTREFFENFGTKLHSDSAGNLVREDIFNYISTRAKNEAQAERYFKKGMKNYSEDSTLRATLKGLKEKGGSAQDIKHIEELISYKEKMFDDIFENINKYDKSYGSLEGFLEELENVVVPYNEKSRFISRLKQEIDNLKFKNMFDDIAEGTVDIEAKKTALKKAQEELKGLTRKSVKESELFDKYLSKSMEQLELVDKINSGDYVLITPNGNAKTKTIYEADMDKILKNAKGFEQEGFELNPYTVLDINKDIKARKVLTKEGVEIYAIPKDMKKMLDNAMGMQMEQNNNALLKLMDTFIGYWKKNALLSFGFHTRNAIGNEFNGFLNVGAKGISPEVVSSHNKIMNKKISDNAIIEIAGKKYKKGEFLNNIKKFQGIDEGQFQEITDMAIGKPLDKPNVLQKVLTDSPLHKASENLGGTIETSARLRNIIANMEMGKSIEEACEYTNKFLIDYSDLTDFEMNTMKRIVPFYTFMRKNIPLQMEQLLESQAPLKIAEKMKNNINEKMDKEDRDSLPPFMKGFMNIGKNKDGTYHMIDFPLPYEDIQKLNVKDMVGSLTPLIKTPMEFILNKDLYFDAPIEEYEGQVNKTDSPLFKLLNTITPDNKYLTTSRSGETYVSPKTQKMLQTLLPQVNTGDKMVSKTINDIKNKELIGTLSNLGITSQKFDAETQKTRRKRDINELIKELITRENILQSN